MRQCYHTIIRAQPSGRFVGWVEEIPGAITCGHSLDECRHNLRESLLLLIQTHRDEARLAMDETCIEEPLELDVGDPPAWCHGSV